MKIEDYKKFLPVGTVVMLEGGTKRVMITGFCSVGDQDSKKVFDYSGCLFPEGLFSSNQICLFDHTQIATIDHLGLVDDEEIKFKEQLNQVLKDMKNISTLAGDVISKEV